MKIAVDKDNKIFLLNTENMSYAFYINKVGIPIHLHWGERIDSATDFLNDIEEIGWEFPDLYEYHRNMEYKSNEPFEQGQMALNAKFYDGTRGVRLRYSDYEIQKGEKSETLILTLKEEHYPLEVKLIYKIFDGVDIISRNSIIKNTGDTPILLTDFKSCTLHLPDRKEYRAMHMYGFTCAEYQKEFTTVNHIQMNIENFTGNSSGHRCIPFIALDEGTATEQSGRVWFGNLHWSGNFKITAEKENYNNFSITAGINEFDTTWNLKPHESFETPEFSFGFTVDGFSGMSKTLYDWQFEHILPRENAYDERPIIYNSFYPYGLDIDEQKLLDVIDVAADVGAELFVIDDGWMEKSEGMSSGCGNWEVSKSRFPRGLKPIADKAHQKGMKFGLWVEPEMVEPQSNLYKEHPEWVLHYPTREKKLTINRIVLNVARDDVKNYIIDLCERLINEYDLDYLKWDMNRSVSEAGWPDAESEEQQSIYIKYIKNIYEIWETIRRRHPNILLENCAAGSGRADFGMAIFADRINRSDNSDPVDVMKIHEGFSTLFLPKLAGGAGNISLPTTWQNQRTAPFDFRAKMGMLGSMSIGMNLLNASEDEIEKLKSYICEFKKIRGELQNSYVYRLVSIFENNYGVLQYVSRDKKASHIFMYAHGGNYTLINRYKRQPFVRLMGLEKDKIYKLSDGRVLSGNYLMTVGIKPKISSSDFGVDILSIYCE